MNPTDQQQLRLVADTIRILAAEAVQRAQSGHPGMPMGMADCAAVLWCRFLKHYPADPNWINRDRFILSAGHGSMLLYSLLHLSGYPLTLDDLREFRQWGSLTPGHPEYGHTPGVETTTGPLGQGFANGVGMAIAARLLAARYNTPDFQLFGAHRIFGIVSDGDLMEGVAAEAASLAGHLQLGELIYCYDSNRITIEGSTGLTFTESVSQRFEAYGWRTLEMDGHDFSAIENALQTALAESTRPTLIITHTHIGYGSPNKHDSADCHGAPLGEEEIMATRKALGWPTDHAFYVPATVYQLFEQRRAQLENEYQDWRRRFETWRLNYPQQAAEFTARLNGDLPDDLEATLLKVAAEKTGATRSLSGAIMQKIAEIIPGFVGGSADLAPSNASYLKQYPSVTADDFSGRNLHFGIREHAMGSILSGLALYGGFRPFGATFLVFSDYMRPPIRLAALMKLPVVYVFTHDSIFVGEDGPTHQPVEQVAALRLIPGLVVIRPADAFETALAWARALRQRGPTALILTRQKVMPLSHPGELKPALWSTLAHEILPGEACPQAVIVASGSEVELAVKVRELIQNQVRVRVISIPSRELWQQLSADERGILAPVEAPVIVIEAGSTTGWGDTFRGSLLTIGVERFGASAPQAVLAEKFGLTPDQVAERILKWLDRECIR